MSNVGNRKDKMTKEIFMPAFIFLFIVGMSLHARFVWVIKQKHPQLHKDLDEPGLFHARNLKAQNFMAKQTLSPDEKYADLTALCGVNFWVGVIYLLVFINVIIGVIK